MTFDIIGGGIGGLTTAIALEQKGFKVRVFEQAKKIKTIGAGIILANNAMQVFEKLGLKKEIEENGNSITTINITNRKLKSLSKIDLRQYEEKYHAKNIAIHRAKLLKILIDKLGEKIIFLDHKLHEVVKIGKGYLLRFENGEQITSELLIGADGLHSKVRQNLFPDNLIRNANQICWRGVTTYELPLVLRHELNESWGKNDRFGFVQIAENKVYWYALKSTQEPCSVSELESSFDHYHSVITKLIAATPLAAINTAEISDLKPSKIWQKENVCLIGDAAHAATPNMGQGACQAIEDAFTLVECLNKYGPNKAFHKFQNIRLKKAHGVVNASWSIGKLVHISNPILIAIRNRMMRMTPTFIAKKKTEQLFKLAQV